MLSLYRKHLARIRQPLSDEEIARFRLGPDRQAERIRAHLARRRAAGALRPLPVRPHVFIAVRGVDWEQAGLVDSWRPLAEVTHYDWRGRHEQSGAEWFAGGRRAFGEELFERVRAVHAEAPVDIFFSYLSGRWVERAVIERIGALGILTVNFDFDDSLKFWNARRHGVYTGSAEIAQTFDVCVTAQSSENVGKYVAIGANPLFLPSGGNEAVFAIPAQSERDIPVSFVGRNYGVRAEMVRHVERCGIEVHKRGHGWPLGPASLDEMLAIYGRSLVTLGFGYIAKTRRLGLKGRDFEVPMTGCAYLTTWNPELADYFEPGKEILFYRDKDDLVETIRRSLADPAATRAIGEAGRERALREHSWQARWRRLISVIG